MFLSADQIVQSGGILLVCLIIFAESGLLIGFFLPGDSLLLIAGIFASTGKISMAALLPLITIAAIAGYEVGYIIGRNLGPKIFKRNDGILFRKEYLKRADSFFQRRGGVSVVLARFVPIVRTFVSVIAGVGKMNRRRYTFYNVIGGIFWCISVTSAGYFLGSLAPELDHYLILIIFILAQVTIIGILWRIFSYKSNRQQLIKGLKEEWHYLFGGHKNRD